MNASTPRKRPAKQPESATPPAKRARSKQPTARTRAQAASPRPRAGTEGQPRYKQQTPVGARLWVDQVNELGPLRRRISQDRTDKTERITDNTLIRVGVDLVLALGDKLHGNTEDELRASALAALNASSKQRSA
jgi:hypothetical protein